MRTAIITVAVLFIGFCIATIDGNCNNRLKCGTFTCNLNNTLSNANWNNGAALLIV